MDAKIPELVKGRPGSLIITKAPTGEIIRVKVVEREEDMVLKDFEKVYDRIASWGINQYMILNKAGKWKEAQEILQSMEKKIHDFRITVWR